MRENFTNYYIGLDIGTTSVGFAVTDSQYRLIKLKGKNLWGSRLFDEADTASERRMNRASRRRYNKRRERIRLLKEIMNDMILEVDSTFFLRLENLSFLDKEDKGKRSNELKIGYQDNYNLFIDEEFNDKTYYSAYPTIYHLRKYLMKSKEKEDPRLIYLAIAHILKYRGHFLYEGEDFNINQYDVEELIEEHFISFFKSLGMEDVPLGKEQYIELHMILVSDDTRSDKQKEMANYLMKYFDKEYKSCITELAKAIVGNVFKAHLLFMDDSLKEEKISLKFDADFDNKCEEVAGSLESRVDILYDLKSIYDWNVLHDILQDSSDLSSAMIKKYEDHKEDLRLLKEVMKSQVDKQQYKDFFNESSMKANYYNYIHHPSLCSADDLYKSIKKILESVHTQEADKIREKMELGIFLPKQTTKDNSVIPYQLNKKELEMILDNQSPYYEDLRLNKDRIMKILEFRIPYYYGPLNVLNLPNHWIVKKEGMENERILPWNHEQVVDVDKTAENFIRRMTNYCTYFTDEPVLPKNSLIVSKYEVLNELNKMRINGKLIPVVLKNKIFDQLFMNRISISEKALVKWLEDQGELLNKEEIEVKGFQKEGKFATSLKPWIDFKRIFGEVNSDNFEMIEQIIFDITVFSDSSILKRRLKDKYHLSKEQIKKIMKLNYSGWSRLSRKLLWDIHSPYKGNPKASIIDIMEMSNHNFMEIINDKNLKFKQIIEDASKKEIDSHFTYEEVSQLQGSPANKKAIWQAVRIIDEIRKIMKCDPQGVYIEFAREENEKRRTKSRKQQLSELYKNMDKEYQEIISTDEYKELYSRLDKENDSFDERKFLYYIQLGKCMYSGEKLEYDQLSHYEIDHILPQSLIKDDSIENKVLVKKLENQYKSDSLTISSTVRSHMSCFWKLLYDRHLITSKKLYNLNRSEFSPQNIEGFINRQLVETRQITKHVTQLIHNHLPQTNVYAVRANLSHDFRVKNGFYKNRNLNDYHHAHDAYIACLLGTYINRRYPHLENMFKYASYKVMNKDNNLKNGKFGFILNGMNKDYIDEETGEIIWLKDYINDVRKYLEYKDCYVTKKVEEFDGPLFKITILPNAKHSSTGKTGASIPVNKYRSSLEKYGGYTNVNSFMVAVEGEKVGKKKTEMIRVIENIPLIYKDAPLEKQIQYLYENGAKMKGLSNIHIIKFIKKNQLIEVDGGYYYLASAVEWNNAIQLLLSEKGQETLYRVNEVLKTNKYEELQDSTVVDLYDEICKKIENHYPLLSANKLIELRNAFIDLNINDKCVALREILKGTSSGKSRGECKLGAFKLSAYGRFNGKIVYLDKTYFVDQSITGFYERRYKL